MFKKLIIFCTAVLATQMALGAVFIKFDGVEGESNDANHQGYSDVLSWSWSSIADTKSVCVEDFKFIKEIDKSSPVLLMDLVSGKFFPQVTLAVTADSSEVRTEFLVLEFDTVQITSHTTTANEDNIPIEEISISFKEVTYSYTEIDATGQPKGTKTATIKSSGKC